MYVATLLVIIDLFVTNVVKNTMKITILVEFKLQDIEEKFSYLKENSTKQQETIIKEFSDSLDKIQQQIFNYIQKFKEKFILEIKREYSPLQINIDTIINKLNKYQQNINDFNIAEQQNQEEQNNFQENIISSNKKEENTDTKKTKQRKISNTYLSQHNIIKLDKNLVTYLLPNYQRCYDQLKCLLELKKNNYRQIKIGCFEILDKKLKKPLKEIIEELISDNNINSQNNQSPNLSFHQDMENLTPLDINQKQLQNIQENKNNIHKMAFQLINPQINQESIFYFNPLTTINLEEIITCNIITGKVITKTQIKEIDPSICDVQSVNDNATLLILTSKNELLWYNYLSNQIIGLKQLQGKKSYLRYITYMKDGNRVTLSQKESNKIKICQFSN
ncbi:hypothetical protein PPERSA_13072 [Pseudocohnilembus persalinus]|uniref:WD40-repeat-containing domain n=1 Tax=Pseudocohnilembus persalinus TaxID=266149 RepID=A0A0V0QWN6_PSEPJ|nr:hypothetical protein PPERSA_13072 [Pseudocohnilembus persalinus]|eukprot:KRX06593.1 hypothetical protein PPERSA_13072 [Pseudocohnilembus persalinus]